MRTGFRTLMRTGFRTLLKTLAMMVAALATHTHGVSAPALVALLVHSVRLRVDVRRPPKRSSLRRWVACSARPDAAEAKEKMWLTYGMSWMSPETGAEDAWARRPRSRALLKW